MDYLKLSKQTNKVDKIIGILKKHSHKAKHSWNAYWNDAAVEIALSLVSEDEKICSKCGELMKREKVTYTDGIGDCWGFTCFGCGRTEEEPLKETDNEIALRVIEEWLDEEDLRFAHGLGNVSTSVFTTHLTKQKEDAVTTVLSIPSCECGWEKEFNTDDGWHCTNEDCTQQKEE